MKKTHNIVAVTGTYKDAAGQEKKRYVTIGAAFTREDGSIAIKLESVPVGGDWNGWANLYLPKDQAKPTETPAAAPTQPEAPAPAEPFNDPIPFGD